MGDGGRTPEFDFAQGKRERHGHEKPSKAANQSDAADLGATARQAVIEIFRNRDPTAIDRFFSEPFVQHDPNIADGLSGLKAFAAEVASSPTADVTIYHPRGW